MVGSGRRSQEQQPAARPSDGYEADGLPPMGDEEVKGPSFRKVITQVCPSHCSWKCNCRGLWAGMHWKGGEVPPSPPGRPAYAQPLSP